MRRMSTYLHGVEPVEQRRLSTLNELVNRGSLGALAASPGEHAIDFGAGLGQLTRGIARATGIAVVGIERSAEQIAEGLRQAAAAGEAGLLDLRQGDAATPPLQPAEWGSFDLAHTRFLLEHVQDPAAVVRAMVRSVRPGGRIVLEDDDHDVLRLWPEPAGFGPIWAAYQRSYDRNGNDPIVGRRLVSLLHAAGAEPRRSAWLPFGSCSGDPAFGLFVDNLVHILDGAREPMLQTRGVSAEQLEVGLEELRLFRERPDAALWYGISWAEGVRP